MKNKSGLFTWILRIVILVYILHNIFTGRIGVAVFNSVLFGISFVILLFRGIEKEIRNKIHVAFLFLAIFNIIGFGFDLYTKVLIFDDLLHLYGGVLLGLFFYFILENKFKNKKTIVPLVLIFVLLGTIGWEMFEFTWDLIFTPIFGNPVAQPSKFDTVIDIIVGFSGAVIAILIYPRIRKK